MRLVTWLMSDPAEIPDVFLARLDHPLVKHVQECLDTGAEFDFDEKTDKATRTRVMGEVLLRFLESLPSSVVPPPLMERCGQAQDKEEAFEVLAEFPAQAKNVWITLTAFLHYLVQRTVGKSVEDPQSLAYTDLLASVFAPILLPNPPKPPFVSLLAKGNFLKRFLQ